MRRKPMYFVGQELYPKQTKFGLHANEKYIVREILGKRNHNTVLRVFYVNENVELTNKLGKWFRKRKR